MKFNALEMDRFTGFPLAQEIIELIVRVRVVLGYRVYYG